MAQRVGGSSFCRALWFALLVGVLPAAALEEWPTYGHDYGDTRFSPLAQITPANVAGLRPVWTYHMKPPGGGGRGGFASSENTPLVVKGIMYVSAPYGRVVALDAETGKQRWAYEVPSGDQPATRGVSYWPGAKPEIVFGTRSGLLIALHADNGAPVKSFGQDGVLVFAGYRIVQAGCCRDHRAAGRRIP